MHYKEVMAGVEKHLADRGGRATTKELADDIGCTTSEVRKAAGYLGHISQPGAMYQPATIVDYRLLSLEELPDVDRWLVRLFDLTGQETLLSTELLQAAKDCGYGKNAFDGAVLRQGCKPKRVKGKWHRTKPGGVVEQPSAPPKTIDDVAARFKTDPPPAPPVFDVPPAAEVDESMYALDYLENTALASLKLASAVPLSQWADEYAHDPRAHRITVNEVLTSLVTKGHATTGVMPSGEVGHAITAAGMARVKHWLATPVDTDG